MEYEEFLSLIDGYIERSTQESDEMPASVFFELLFKRLTEKATETIELEIEIVDNQPVWQRPFPSSSIQSAPYPAGNPTPGNTGRQAWYTVGSVERLSTRTNNPYGKHADEVARDRMTYAWR